MRKRIERDSENRSLTGHLLIFWLLRSVITTCPQFDLLQGHVPHVTQAPHRPQGEGLSQEYIFLFILVCLFVHVLLTSPTLVFYFYIYFTVVPLLRPISCFETTGGFYMISIEVSLLSTMQPSSYIYHINCMPSMSCPWKFWNLTEPSKCSPLKLSFISGIGLRIPVSFHIHLKTEQLGRMETTLKYSNNELISWRYDYV